MSTTYSLYGEYDENGRARQLTVMAPENTSLDVIAELVSMLYKAGQAASLPSLAETRVLRPSLDNAPTGEYWNPTSYR